MKMINIIYSILALGLSGLSVHGQIFNILLSGSQADGTTLTTATGSAGYATVELSGTELSYSIFHEGIGSLTNSHFHGPAAAGVNAGVSVGVPPGASPIVGNAVLTAQQASDFGAGNIYLNLHSSVNPGGELRGQVVQQLSFTPNMIISGSQTTAGNLSKGAGAALVIFNTATNELSWQIGFEGLASGVTNAHFHGPAAAGVNAGVKQAIAFNSGVSFDSLSGSAVVANQSDVDDLLGGLWYINIHTASFPGGEIRGQVSAVVVPEASTITLFGGLAAMAMVLFWRRRS